MALPPALLPIAGLLVIGAATSASAQSSLRLVPSTLTFAALPGGAAPPVITPPQVLFLEHVGPGRPPWTAQAADPWIDVRPTSGFAPARLSLGVRRSAIGGLAGTVRGEVVVTVGEGEASSTHHVTVMLTVLRGNGQPPFGALDLPAEGTVARDARLVVAGWALDDISVTDVRLCGERAAGAAQGCTCEEAAGVVTGHATFGDEGRPDVARLFPALPLSTRSAWGYVLDLGALAPSAGESFRICAVARDAQGQAALLGERTVVLDLPGALGWRATATPLLMLLAAALLATTVHLLLWARCRPDPTPAPGRTAESAGIRPLEWAAAAAILLTFVALQLPSLTRGLEYDELYSASRFIVDTPLWRAATAVGMFNNHIAYSLAANGTVRLLGHAEWVLRLPAVIFGALAVVVVWRFTRATAGRQAGLLAAALLASSPFFLDWSRTARGYTGLALMTLLSSCSFLAVIRTGSTRAAMSHGVATALAVYFHLYGACVVLVQYALLVWLVLRRTDRDTAGRPSSPRHGQRLLWWSFAASGALAAFLYLPALPQLAEIVAARGRTGVNVALPGDLARALTGTDSSGLAAVAGLLAAVGLQSLRRRPLEAAYLAALLVVPFLVMWLVARPVDLYVRFFVYWQPYFACLVALGVVGLSRRLLAPPTDPRRGVRSAMALVPWIAVGVLGAGWLRQDVRPAPEAGYRDTLQPLSPPDALAPSFAVGADAEIFDYYMGKPLRTLHFVQEAERALRELPRLRVAYHDMSWNSPQQREIADLLARRCQREHRPPVAIFRCGL